MANTLISPPVQTALTRMFAEAGRDHDNVPGGRTGPDVSPLERAEALQDAYLPISAEAGRLLYTLVRAIRPETVVEFGTSFGISTIYLAAAVTDNGVGHVVTTELSSRKV